MKRLLVFGDSVGWGQGLEHDHKYASLLAGEFGLSVEMYAHSGATIGLRSTTLRQAHGEIPISWPTVSQQIDAVPPAEDVSVVLLNGGINDVDIRTIFNPCTDELDLQEDIQRFCQEDLAVVLGRVVERFAAATVLVGGYYPILSERTDWDMLFPFLTSLGVGSAWPVETPTLIGKLVRMSLLFRTESDRAIDAAVALFASTGRVRFVPCPFTEANAVFADDPLLFGLLPFALEPEDEVIPERRAACTLYYSQPRDVFSLFQCLHASAGHPNRRGAQAIRTALVEALAPTLSPP